MALSYEAFASSASVLAIEQNTIRPSALARRSSDARSGCGIMPSTFLSRLQIPAMLSMEPFGFESGHTLPSPSEYLKMIRFSLFSSANVDESQ